MAFALMDNLMLKKMRKLGEGLRPALNQAEIISCHKLLFTSWQPISQFTKEPSSTLSWHQFPVIYSFFLVSSFFLCPPSLWPTPALYILLACNDTLLNQWDIWIQLGSAGSTQQSGCNISLVEFKKYLLLFSPHLNTDLWCLLKGCDISPVVA